MWYDKFQANSIQEQLYAFGGKKKPRILCGALKELAFPGRQKQEAVERTVSEMLAAVSEYIWSVGLILGERG